MEEQEVTTQETPAVTSGDLTEEETAAYEAFLRGDTTEAVPSNGADGQEGADETPGEDTGKETAEDTGNKPPATAKKPDDKKGGDTQETEQEQRSRQELESVLGRQGVELGNLRKAVLERDQEMESLRKKASEYDRFESLILKGPDARYFDTEKREAPTGDDAEYDVTDPKSVRDFIAREQARIRQEEKTQAEQAIAKEQAFKRQSATKATEDHLLSQGVPREKYEAAKAELANAVNEGRLPELVWKIANVDTLVSDARKDERNKVIAELQKTGNAPRTLASTRATGESIPTPSNQLSGLPDEELRVRIDRAKTIEELDALQNEFVRRGL
jgi:hypothetical protein